MKKSGIFTVSIDLELAWGICDKPIGTTASSALMREREIIQRLLELFSRYHVQATWAVVGHLLLDRCHWQNERVHPEISRPIVRNEKRDWFFQHPNHPGDDRWYGRDIVEWIRSASPRQEIGSHSFCHMPYDEAMTAADAVSEDIRRAKELHEALRLPFEVFIFPRNRVGYRPLLAQAGLRAYRGNSHRWYDSLPFPCIRRAFNLLSFIVPVTPQTVQPTVDETGMINIPDSMLLFGREGLRRVVSPNALARKAIRGLERAVKRSEIFHLWFHPANFAHAMEGQFAAFETILGHARRLRDAGRLEIRTMGDIHRSAVHSPGWNVPRLEQRKTGAFAAPV
jgi:peptidoglycan/xylan/chitin deacetylase (PgdA/CDA1 family)